MLKIGDRVLITVPVEIVFKDTGHGTCYQVMLPQKDYQNARTIWVDLDEIEKQENDLNVVEESKEG